ncbi:uncharacterized protein LOC133890877 [Phragmites australis]|uniref:uncharacterized protein LOC133890877 n=1 Tax=Phragmites australis TaxID=29695 RepID=UPI002D76A7D9|nr:uncharacterized protein LOC133890877 [Phragmites australis]
MEKGAVDQYGILEIRGPLMVGGVQFLIPATGLFRDHYVRRLLSSKQRFQAFLQFQEQTFKIFAIELVSASKYPLDLVLFTHEDGQRFRNDYWFHYIVFRDKSHLFILDDQSKESGVDNNSITSVTAGDQSDRIDDYKNDKESRLQDLHYDLRYFAYRKGLLKLDISQFNNDPKKAVQWLKSSTGWSELSNEELRRGLKSYMDFLKEQEMSTVNQQSVSESKNVALETINAELASALEKTLYTSDWAALMSHYYNRMKVRNLARVCSIQAQETGVILVEQALPLREICKEQTVSTSPEVLKFPFMKQNVKQLLEGCVAPLRWMHEEFGRGAKKYGRGARSLALLAFIPFATVATAGGMLNKR